MAKSQRLAGEMREYLITAAGVLAAMIVLGPVAFGAFGGKGVGAVLFGACLGVGSLRDDIVIGVAKGPAWILAFPILGLRKHS
jgi:hypothetical protein